MGEAEGAFLPCTFWLATALAKLGRDDEAEAMLETVEAIAGERGLFAEEADPGARAFLGNMPLLFSHAEHLPDSRKEETGT
jgi:GH15 family glucan-1,4-alpha-glucosidase